MIRLYRGGNGGLRFAGKNPEAEQAAAAAQKIRARRLDASERLHEQHMALLGAREDPTRGIIRREGIGRVFAVP